MRPVLVMPMNDPSGILFRHLEAVLPELETLFAHAFVSLPTTTQKNQPGHYHRVKTDGFFKVICTADDVGEQFLTLYAKAAASSQPGDILHLCFVDRLAFALSDKYRKLFAADIRASVKESTPLLYQRSSLAWNTHPSNYRELEQMVTRTGQMLFGRSLDYAWCHLVLEARQLALIVQNVRNRDLSVLAEFVLALRDTIRTKDVDWLAWEDPFILGIDPEQLRGEREQSSRETRKRLEYVIPMLQLLWDAAGEN